MKYLPNLGITQRLFVYFSSIFLVIFTILTIIESILLNVLLTLPDELQAEFQQLAVKAEHYILTNDIAGLAAWEEAQEYTLYVVDEKNQSIAKRQIHPYVRSKMSFSYNSNKPVNNHVSKPMIAIDLPSNLTLMIQLPWQLHPADQAKYYLWATRFCIASIFLALVSWLFSKHLQRPLIRLQDISHQIASGNLTVRMSDKLYGNIKEFNELARDFDHMTDQIEKLVLSHKKLLRNISHELRTPLTRQNLALHLLKNKITAEQVKYLQPIEENTHEMNDLIQQILDFSRLESRYYKVKLQPKKLANIINKVISEITAQAQSTQKITFSTQVPDALALVECDLIARMLKNALSNALKYAGDTCQITVRTYLKASHLVLEISDNGPGLSQLDLPRIFEPFYRVDNSITAKTEGYGLGMSIMKQSIEQMNGSITAESKFGQGLTIRCNLETPTHI